MKKLKDFSRVLLTQLAVLLLIIGISALGYYSRKDIQISYHKWGHESALKSMRKLGSPSTESDFRRIEKYSERRQKHKDALIELGYLEQRVFETKYIGAFSSEMRKAAEEFNVRYPGNSYSIGDRGEHKISITCKKIFMPVMEELIVKYDIPPDDPNKEKL